MSFIETPRLLLRTWMPSDLAAAARIAADPEVMRGVGAGSPWSSAATAAALERTSADYDRDGIGVWPVVRKLDGCVVGACGLQRAPLDGDVELVCVLARELWGTGSAAEAARAVLDWGFGERRLARIVAFAHPNVPRAVRFLHRIGMDFDRVVRAYRADLLRYAVRANTPARTEGA